jgi:gp16 family phage-associated protein
MEDECRTPDDAFATQPDQAGAVLGDKRVPLALLVAQRNAIDELILARKADALGRVRALLAQANDLIVEHHLTRHDLTAGECALLQGSKAHSFPTGDSPSTSELTVPPLAERRGSTRQKRPEMREQIQTAYSLPPGARAAILGVVEQLGIASMAGPSPIRAADSARKEKPIRASKATPVSEEWRARCEQVRAEFYARGEPIADWARARGFRPSTVYQVLHCLVQARWGNAHQVAVALGIKSATDAQLSAPANNPRA